jgi:Gpi18-like mannosyltransferase
MRHIINFNLTGSFKSYLINKRCLVYLIIIGLLIRLPGAFLYGTQDTEYWKGWADYAVNHSISDIYGESDQNIIKMWEKGYSLSEILHRTQRIIPFPKVYSYSVTGYPLCQPPLFLYSIYPGAWVYHILLSQTENGRLCNFFTNLQPILFSFLTALIILLFVSREYDALTGRYAFLIFWLNPLIILNTPYQGYQDSFCSFLVMIAVIAAFYKKPFVSYIIISLSMLVKPWGIFVAPALLWVLMREHSFGKNCRAIMAAGFVSICICLPFIATGHIMSMFYNIIFSLGQHTLKLSLQACNLWWPVQYSINVYAYYIREKVTLWQAISCNEYVYNDVTTAYFSSHTGISATQVSLLLWGIFTIYNLYWISSQKTDDRKAIIIGCTMQIFLWYLLRTGLQGHHAIVMIPIMTLIAFQSYRFLLGYSILCTLLFLQEIIFYGLGRDFNPLRKILVDYHMPWLTVVISVAQIVLFLIMLREIRSSKLTRSPSGCLSR